MGPAGNFSNLRPSDNGTLTEFKGAIPSPEFGTGV